MQDRSDCLKGGAGVIVQLVGSSSCPSCRELESSVLQVVAERGVDAEIRKVTDPAGIMACGVMALPGLVINGRIAVSGRVPSLAELGRVFDAAGA